MAMRSSGMARAVGILNHRRAVIRKTLAIDPALASGQSYAWHVWLWWLNSFDLIDAER